MPTTSYNVAQIKNVIGNYTTAQILDALNEVHQIVMSDNNEQNKKINPATGMPPYLVTTAGTRQYDCPADCREVSAIFCKKNFNSYNIGSINDINTINTYYNYRGTVFYRMAVTSTVALYNDLASVTFINDPGSTTDVYYLDYFVKPLIISSVSVQMKIPEEGHYLVRKLVIAMLSDENYGDTMAYIQLMSKLKQLVKNRLNRGVQAREGRAVIQPEYRDW
jgi:hypothetical protein